MVKACTESSMADLQQFVILREVRRRIIGEEAMALEMGAETAEGLTEYAGLAALNQFSRAKSMEEIERHLKALRNPKNLYDIRFAARSSGCILCFTLKSFNIDFFHPLSEGRTIYEFVPRLPNEIDASFNEYCKENGL